MNGQNGQCSRGLILPYKLILNVQEGKGCTNNQQLGAFSCFVKKSNMVLFISLVCSNKKQVIAIGKKTGCDVELHPVEIIYNTPSILLFCRYANALRKLPYPLGRQHLKRSRRGAVLFVQHHLLDSVVGRRLGRLGVFQLVFVHRVPTLSSSLEQCGRNT